MITILRKGLNTANDFLGPHNIVTEKIRHKLQEALDLDITSKNKFLI